MNWIKNRYFELVNLYNKENKKYIYFYTNLCRVNKYITSHLVNTKKYVIKTYKNIINPFIFAHVLPCTLVDDLTQKMLKT